MRINPRTALYAGSICISLSPIFVRLAGVSGLSTNFYRAFFAFIILLPYVLWRRLYKAAVPLIISAIIGGILFSIDLAFWNVAVTRIDVMTATILGNLAPVWTGILALALFKEKQSVNYWLGVLLALAGALVLSGAAQNVNLKFNSGYLLAITGGIFYALYLLTTQKTRATMHTISFMFFSLTGYVASSLIICLIMKAPLVGFSISTWTSFVGSGFIAQLAGWIFISYALGHLRSTEVSLTLLSLTVTWCTIMAIIFFKEIPAWNQVIGTVIILMSVALNHFKKNEEQKILST